MRLGDLDALKEDLRRFFPDEVLEGIEPKTIFNQIMHDIDNAPTIPLPDFKEGYKQAILDGKTNFTRPQDEWIPVSERLPEESGVYIVTEKIFAIDDRNHRGKFKVETECVEFQGGRWNRAKFFEVIAWQPLPEPYKKGGVE